ncbi:MAG: hypothetical protein CO141_03990 [Candidatus Moranbacteria bacterium CG_4_9_14_3_um_filter_42_9]|nr:MAG: hypothetical protein CO141_03990 [Candidatus Moranbacteria bacterium CG_4_9_14_3_um_filter_42_9]
MANFRLIFYCGLVITVIGVTAYFYFFKNSPSDTPLYISNLEECVRAGYPVLETYSRQCRTPEGTTLLVVLKTRNLFLCRCYSKNRILEIFQSMPNLRLL